MADKAIKKKPNVFLRFGRAIGRFFRDTRGEMKKVTWPSRKQVRNNFFVVMIFVIVAAVFIGLLDALFLRLLGLLVGLA